MNVLHVIVPVLLLPVSAVGAQDLLTPGSRVRIEAADRVTEGTFVSRTADTMFVRPLGFTQRPARAIPAASIRLIEVGRRDYGKAFLVGALLTGGIFALTMSPKETDQGVRPGTDAQWIAGAALGGGLVSMAVSPYYRWVRVQP
jgi:hypothetical protein